MPTQTQTQPTTRPLSTIPPKPLQWLWHPRIPKGKITLLAADPGSGKTTLALSLAAHLSRGEPLPTSPLETRNPKLETPAATLLLSPEDNPADTLIPKLQALNANLSHIHILENLHSLIPQKLTTDHRQLATVPPSPLQLLESAIQSIPNLAILIIDPITHYLGLTDRIQTLHPSDPTQLRSTLHALSHLAEKYNLAILLTTRLTKSLPHQTKAHASDAWVPSLHRTLGSLAFASTARSVLLLLPHPQNPHDRLLATIKSNLVEPPPTLSFTLNNTITWHPDPISIHQLATLHSPAPSPPKPPTQRDLAAQSAADWLRTELADGPVTSYSITEAAKDNAIPPYLLQQARQIAQVQSIKQSWSGKWFMALPNDTRPLPEDPTERTIAEILNSTNLGKNEDLFRIPRRISWEKTSPPQKNLAKISRNSIKNRKSKIENPLTHSSAR